MTVPNTTTPHRSATQYNIVVRINELCWAEIFDARINNIACAHSDWTYAKCTHLAVYIVVCEVIISCVTILNILISLIHLFPWLAAVQC